MDFKEFVNKLEQDLKEALSDISPGAQVRQTSVKKPQESVSHLLIRISE